MNSPIDVLGRILDEVQGVRQFDVLSHLPENLIQQAREALEALEVPTHGDGQMLSSVGELEGRFITKVVECGLKSGDYLLMCSDGTFLVLEGADDGDGPYATAATSYRGARTIQTFMHPRTMVEVGLITSSAARELELDLARTAADEAVASARRRLDAALATQTKLNKERN